MLRVATVGGVSTIEVQIPLPDDWHVHLRDDEMLAAVAGYSAERFGRSLIMPNLTPPIVTWDAASSYRDRIIGAVDNAPASFEPLMSLYLTPAISIDDLRIGAESGQLGGVSSTRRALPPTLMQAAHRWPTSIRSLKRWSNSASRS